MAKQTISSNRYPPNDVELELHYADGSMASVPLRRRVPVWTVAQSTDAAQAAQFEPDRETQTLRIMMKFVGDAVDPDFLSDWERFTTDEACDYRALIGMYEDVMAAVTKRPTQQPSQSSPGFGPPTTGGYVAVPSPGAEAEVSTPSGTTPTDAPASS